MVGSKKSHTSYLDGFSSWFVLSVSKSKANVDALPYPGVVSESFITVSGKAQSTVSEGSCANPVFGGVLPVEVVVAVLARNTCQVTRRADAAAVLPLVAIFVIFTLRQFGMNLKDKKME